MKLISKWLIPLLLAAMVLTSCSGVGKPLPTPKISVTTVPEAKSNAQAYLSAWEKEDYATMYNLLSTKSQAVIKQEDFSKKRKYPGKNLLPGIITNIIIIKNKFNQNSINFHH